MLLAAGITLINARPFSATNSVAASFSATLTLPPGAYVPMAMIVKTARPDGTAQFNVGFGAPVEELGPVDYSVWFRAAALVGTNTSTTFGLDASGAGTGLGIARLSRRLKV